MSTEKILSAWDWWTLQIGSVFASLTTWVPSTPEWVYGVERFLMSITMSEWALIAVLMMMGGALLPVTIRERLVREREVWADSLTTRLLEGEVAAFKAHERQIERELSEVHADWQATLTHGVRIETDLRLMLEDASRSYGFMFDERNKIAAECAALRIVVNRYHDAAERQRKKARKHRRVRP